MPLTRRTLLTAVPLAAAAAGLPVAAHAAPALSIRGADISFTLQSERAGARYRVGGRQLPLERAIAQAGANWVRLRVWVDPPAGYSDLASTITLARRAKAAGHQVLVDLHYSDFWADPAHQTIPARWRGQDLATTAATVRAYTRDTLDALDRAGARADMVQVGNEIHAGMLWPLGQIYRPGRPENFADFATLLRAGVEGARAARGAPRVMIHIDRGGDNEGSRYFYDRILAAGVRFDVIGLSYYPFWHGPLARLDANLTDLAARYRKPLVVVETAYPFTLDNADGLENLISRPDQLPDIARWPATWEGQRAYFRALRDVLVRVGAAGFFAWEPGWLAGVGWEPGAGNPNDNLTLFNWSGDANPALTEAFRP